MNDVLYKTLATNFALALEVFRTRLMSFGANGAFVSQGNKYGVIVQLKEKYVP